MTMAEDVRWRVQPPEPSEMEGREGPQRCATRHRLSPPHRGQHATLITPRSTTTLRHHQPLLSLLSIQQPDPSSCFLTSTMASSASSAPSSSSSSLSTSSSTSASASGKNKRYRKDKPWDTDDIDHWAPISVTPDTPLPPPLEESSFAVLFPRYREKYLREVWPLLTSTLKAYGVACELDLIEGSMSVRTTRRCWDVSMIVKARDVLKLLSRSLPVHQAVRVLQDEVYCDVVKIKNLVRNKERFVKRRQRLIGPNGCTLKAIELVTECYVLVQGNTVSCIGSLKGIKAVRRIVEECMRNIHPIYHIKLLMMKQQLQQDPELKHDNWDRFLPKFKKKTVQSKRQRPQGEEGKEGGKAHALFPPEPTKRKVDLQMESGEFFLSQEQKEEKEQSDKKRQREAKAEAKRQEREKQFAAPAEEKEEGKAGAVQPKAQRRNGEAQGKGEREERKAGEEAGLGMGEEELSALKAKLSQGKKTRGSSGVDATRFFIGGRRTEEQTEAKDEAAVDGNGSGQERSKKRKNSQREEQD